MPSMIPLLSYSLASQDDDCSTSTSPSSKGSIETSPKSSRKDVDKKKSKSSGKDPKVSRKPEGSSKEAKKTGKKKRRPVGKLSSRNVPSNNGVSDKVEELVAKATAHAQAVQAVKKAILEIQLFLLDGVKNKSQLQGTSPLLTQTEYADVVTERSIVRQCGYPLCQKGLTEEKTRKGRYRISLHEHKVYDLNETRLFCSANCLVASKTFQSSLQIERDEIMGKEKLTSIMQYIRDPHASKLLHSTENSKDRQNQSGLLTESLVSGIQEREDSGMSSFDDAGPFDAIEGYVPQNSIRHWGLNNNALGSVNAASGQLEWGADLERMAISNEPTLTTRPDSKLMSMDKGKAPMILDELNVEISPVPLLKSALKKGKTESVLKRSVSWEDQKKRDQKAERKDQRFSPRLKERSKVHTHNPQSALHASARDLSSSRETVIAGSSVTISSNSDQTKGKSNPHGLRGQVASSSVLGGSSVGPEETAQGKSIPVVLAKDSEMQKSRRVLSAEAVAAALLGAAEAAAGGEIESVEAVTQAGLSIVPVSESVGESVSVNVLSEDSLNDLNEKPAMITSSSTEVDARWPRLEMPDKDDLDDLTARASWHDTPPMNFKVEVSMFGTIWMALEEWISAATIAHVYGKEPQDQDEFVVANGREFRRQVHVADSTSAEIAKTFSACISRAFPDVVQALRLNVPISTMEQTIGHLVRTMTFIEALPSFSIKHWRMILMLLLDGLSVQRLPTIGVHLTNNMSLLRKFLDSTGTSEAEYDTFRGLLLPLGRLPTFSTMSGG